MAVSRGRCSSGRCRKLPNLLVGPLRNGNGNNLTGVHAGVGFGTGFGLTAPNNR